MRITPKNWGDFQHYTGRNPPWVKLHKKLLDDYEYQCLPVASRALAPMLWLLASEDKDGIIDASEIKLAFRLRMTTQELIDAIMPLIRANFFSLEQDASAALAPCKPDAMPEREGETEAETEKMSDKSDVRSKPSGYSEEFTEFWSTYPTDPNMSKKAAFAQWQRLDQPSRDAARAAIPAFKAYCRKNTTYRPVHAQKFLSDRRFDGFNAAGTSPAFEATDERGWQDRLRVWREKAGWHPKWGPDPSKPDCKCPPNILKEAA